MEKIYDWIGVGKIILDYAAERNRKTLFVLDIQCGDGSRLAYLKKIIDPYVKIKAAGCPLTNKEETKKNITVVEHKKKNYSWVFDESVKPDVVLDIKLTWDSPPIRTNINYDSNMLYLTNSFRRSIVHGSLIPPKPSEKRAASLSQKTYGLKIHDGKPKNPYIEYNMHEILLNYARSIGKNSLSVLDVGCNDCHSILDCRKFLKKHNIALNIIGVDVEVLKGQDRVDEFHHNSFYNLKNKFKVDCVIASRSIILATDKDRIRLINHAKKFLNKAGILVYYDQKPLKFRKLQITSMGTCILGRSDFYPYLIEINKRDYDKYMHIIHTVEQHRKFLDFMMIEKPVYGDKMDAKLNNDYGISVSEYAMAIMKMTNSMTEAEMIFSCGNIKFKNVLFLLIKNGLADKHGDKIRLNLRTI